MSPQVNRGGELRYRLLCWCYGGFLQLYQSHNSPKTPNVKMKNKLLKPKNITEMQV